MSDVFFAYQTSDELTPKQFHAMASAAAKAAGAKIVLIGAPEKVSEEEALANRGLVRDIIAGAAVTRSLSTDKAHLERLAAVISNLPSSYYVQIGDNVGEYAAAASAGLDNDCDAYVVVGRENSELIRENVENCQPEMRLIAGYDDEDPWQADLILHVDATKPCDYARRLLPGGVILFAHAPGDIEGFATEPLGDCLWAATRFVPVPEVEEEAVVD